MVFYPSLKISWYSWVQSAPLKVGSSAKMLQLWGWWFGKCLPPNPRKLKKGITQTSCHTNSVPIIFSVKAHILLDMSQNFSKQLEGLKLDNKKSSKFVQKQFPRAQSSNYHHVKPSRHTLWFVKGKDSRQTLLNKN